MLVIDGLSNVERLSIEGIAQQVVTRIFRGLAVRGASRNGKIR
jgi:hypothetical protein